MYPNGSGGFTQWATGTRKGVSREEADQNWGRSGSFEILEVAEDGTKLQNELVDLDRDAANYERGAQVSHGAESEQAPELELGGLSDNEIDQKLQEYLKRGPR